MLTRTLPFVSADPLSLWATVHPHPNYGFFLGSMAGTENDHRVYFSAGEPSQLFQVNSKLKGEGWEGLKNALEQKKPTIDFPKYVGFFGFEAGRLFDAGLARHPSPPDPLEFPALLFGDYPAVVGLDLKKRTTTFTAATTPELDRIEAIIIRRKNKGVAEGPTNSALPNPHPNGFEYASLEEFSNRVVQAKQAIARGDIYQANLSLRFERPFQGDPIALYRRLCLKNPSPYAALFKFGARWIVSCSPELLVSVQGQTIRTRPIAGTRPRGATRGKDRKLKGQLLLSPKERAEHIMLVDLERNDVGRVAVPGSVSVTERFLVENYSHVMHIVSQVEGRLQPNRNATDVVEALFPGGTITGCPKIRSVETIEKLEGTARGPFYGSAGYFSGNGNAAFNILIRTALVQNKKIYIQAGAGIVADSNPAREYQESLSKAQALLEAVEEEGVKFHRKFIVPLPFARGKGEGPGVGLRNRSNAMASPHPISTTPSPSSTRLRRAKEGN